jgi:hypothetical protein
MIVRTLQLEIFYTCIDFAAPTSTSTPPANSRASTVLVDGLNGSASKASRTAKSFANVIR